MPVRRRRFIARILGVLALAAVAALAFLFDLGRPALWDPGEGRYALTVHEMLLTGNWLVPTLNFAPYYDKPPGFYWIVASAFTLLGPSAWSARLPSALGALATIALTVAFAWRRVGPRAAVASGAVLATAILFVVIGRSVRMDALLTLGVAGSLFAAYRVWDTADDRTAPSRPATWPIYWFLAIGIVVKGPVAAVLPSLVLATFAVMTRDYRKITLLRPGLGGLAALAVASLWYVAAAINAPLYLWTFLWDQNVGRFVEGATGHTEPIWFFLWVLPVAFLPWTLFLPPAVREAARRARDRSTLDLFLLTWTGVVLVFFTFSRAKLATYVLPVFPALAVVVGSYLAGLSRTAPEIQRRVLRVPATIWIAALAIGTVATTLTLAVRFPSYAPTAAAALLLGVFPVAGAVALRRGWVQAVPVLILACALSTQMLFYRAGAPIVDEFSSLKTAAEAARELPASAQVVAYKTNGYSFSFYGGRIVRRVRSPAAAAAALAGAEPAALLTKSRYVEKIAAHLTDPVSVWWQGPSGRVLVVNRPPLLTARLRVIEPSPARGAAPGVDETVDVDALPISSTNRTETGR